MTIASLSLGMVNLHKFGMILKLKEFSFKIYQKLKIDFPCRSASFCIQMYTNHFKSYHIIQYYVFTQMGELISVS